MNRLLISLVLTGLISCNEPQIPETKVKSGDFILVKGRVMHCDDWGEFMIEYGQVTANEVNILTHNMYAVGLSTSELEVSIKQSIYTDINHWPLLSIEILTEEEFNLMRDEIEKGIDMYYEAIDACDKKIEDFRKRSKEVATLMYNKTFKYALSGQDACSAGAS